MDVAQHFARLSVDWKERYRQPAFRQRLELIVKELGSERRPHERWLDAGCGAGVISNWLSQTYGCAVVGIDSSPEMVAHCEAGEGLEFRVSDVARTGFEDRTYDGLVCSSVLQYVDDPDLVLREFLRVLKPGGLLLISVPNAAKAVRLRLTLRYLLRRRILAGTTHAMDFTKNAFTKSSFAKKLVDAGFEVLRVTPFSRSTVRLYPFRKRLPLASGTLIMFAARRPG